MRTVKRIALMLLRPFSEKDERFRDALCTVEGANTLQEVGTSLIAANSFLTGELRALYPKHASFLAHAANSAAGGHFASIEESSWQADLAELHNALS